MILNLRPTDVLINYKVKLLAYKNRKIVKIFVIEPKINKYENDKEAPHLYPDDSLCLYYLIITSESILIIGRHADSLDIALAVLL